MLKISKSSIKGIKEKNQDKIGVKLKKDSAIFIVCDGIGSLQKSELASKIVVNTFLKHFRKLNTFSNVKEWFDQGLKIAFYYLQKKANFIDEKIGTTIALVIIVKNKAYFFNIGDTRIYLYFNEKIKQISFDHSFYNKLKKDKIKTSIINKNKFRWGYITNFIDSNSLENAIYHFDEVILEKHSIILLCSDGLYNFIDINDNFKYIAKNNKIKYIANELNYQSLKNKSYDNISNVIIKYE